jgi:hypothetical protein
MSARSGWKRSRERARLLLSVAMLAVLFAARLRQSRPRSCACSTRLRWLSPLAPSDRRPAFSAAEERRRLRPDRRAKSPPGTDHPGALIALRSRFSRRPAGRGALRHRCARARHRAAGRPRRLPATGRSGLNGGPHGRFGMPAPARARRARAHQATNRAAAHALCGLARCRSRGRSRSGLQVHGARCISCEMRANGNLLMGAAGFETAPWWPGCGLVEPNYHRSWRLWGGFGPVRRGHRRTTRRSPRAALLLVLGRAGHAVRRRDSAAPLVGGDPEPRPRGCVDAYCGSAIVTTPEGASSSGGVACAAASRWTRGCGGSSRW